MLSADASLPTRFEILHRGTSLMIRLVVNNPPLALQRADPGNVWTVTFRGDGDYPGSQVAARILLQPTVCPVPRRKR